MLLLLWLLLLPLLYRLMDVVGVLGFPAVAGRKAASAFETNALRSVWGNVFTSGPFVWANFDRDAADDGKDVDEDELLENDNVKSRIDFSSEHRKTAIY